MSDDPRPDSLEGLSTETGGTPGDPERRSNTLAPDLSDDRTEPDDAGVQESDAHVRDDIHVTGSDLTKGEEPLNPH
ncbi:MAG: hypothetical protein R3181_04705 [Rubricoccaceae bacterium]|nr:hypothetical protein [Rubricoccaceae bacterium]